MWIHVRAVALEILRTAVPTAQASDLDRIILSTGYPWADNSFDSISDLIAVYAASLRNGGGPGPGYEAFSRMIKTSVADHITQNRLIQPLQKASLAQACEAYQQQRQSMPLAIEGTVDYIGDLHAIAQQTPLRPRALMPQLIESVVRFSEVLSRAFNGSAAEFHAAFNRAHVPADPAGFVLERFQSFAGIPKVGVALAMNFFKDSQVPALRNQPLQHLLTNQIGWFIKPDIHVLRFMLKASGRAGEHGFVDDELIYMKEQNVRSAYVARPATAAWAQEPYTYCTLRPRAEKAQWQCIEDVHRLARLQRIPALEIDRVLFMVGSGRFIGNRRIGPPQAERYRKLFRPLNGL